MTNGDDLKLQITLTPALSLGERGIRTYS